MCQHQHQHQHQHQPGNILCPSCDLLVVLTTLPTGSKALCPRCNTVLFTQRANIKQTSVNYAFSGLFMLILACLFSFVDIQIQGIYNQITLLDIPMIIWHEHYIGLAVLMTILLIIAPLLCILSVLLFFLFPQLNIKFRQALLKGIFIYRQWCMVEIFIAGVLVSFVKLIAYGEVGIGPSFIAYCLFCLLQIKLLQQFDCSEMWSRVQEIPILSFRVTPGLSGLAQGLRACQCCHAILPAKQYRCPRCTTKGYVRKKQSFQWTLALLLTACILYIPANLLPIMITELFGTPLKSNIMSGIILLWQEGAYPIALIIFIASIMVPVVKIFAMGWLCWDVKQPVSSRSKQMLFVYRVVEFIGRWSMIDVFVITVLASLVRMDNFMGVYPAIGVVIFAMVVLITMLSAMSFDPRLSWDHLNKLEINREKYHGSK